MSIDVKIVTENDRPVNVGNPLPVTFEGDVSFDTTNLEAGIGAPDDGPAATPETVGSLIAKIGGMWDDLSTLLSSTATASVSQDTAIMKNGATSLTPKFAAVAASSSGDNTVVALVSGKKIRVLAYNLMGAGAVNARWQTSTAGAYLTGLKYIAAAGGGICAPFNPLGWFETVAGDLLNLELSGAVAVGGEIVYIEV